jgi:hypothetical protein
VTAAVRLLRNAGPSRPAFFVASALAHAAVIGAFWHGRPLPRLPASAAPALVVALPSPGVVDTPVVSPHPAAEAPLDPVKTPADPAERVVVAAPAQATGLDLGVSALVRNDAPQTIVRPADAATDEPPAAPPPAAATSRAIEKVDLNLAYHRLRAAQESMRQLHGQAAHLAWLQKRVSDLLATAVAPVAANEGGLCQARLAGDTLAIDCDRAPLHDVLQQPVGDLAIFLRKLVALTSPDQGLEIAFLPDAPPVIARL